MEFRLGMAQSGYPADGDVISQAESFARRAEEQDVSLLVFPEDFMWPRKLSAAELRELAEPLDGPFVQDMARIAHRHGLWMAFTMNEANPAGGPPFNTLAVVGAAGVLRGAYRKCHLYDAHGVFESERLSAGDGIVPPLDTPFGKIGLAICYDLRFPEMARKLAADGADLLLYPAAWHAGPQKLVHWETLLRARAIENECFVAGACRAGGKYTGRSIAFDPLGRELAAAPPNMGAPGDEVLVVCNVDPAAVATAREAMPVLDHRRPGLYR